MNAILNYNFYNKEMKKGLMDKLFFMSNKEIQDKLRVIIDYGCADGSLIEEMSLLYPNINFIGFDLDEDMIKLAMHKQINNAQFINNFKEVVTVKKSKGMSAILCSSVIHEVYSYGTNKDINEFWHNLNNGDHDYIFIRDMCFSKEDANLKKLDLTMLSKILEKADRNQLTDFQNVWGKFKNNADMIHFLYKYRYLDNWKREVEENYFPIFFEDYFTLIDMSKFEIVYKEHFLLAYQKEIIFKDFGINLYNNTHVKLILKRK